MSATEISEATFVGMKPGYFFYSNRESKTVEVPDKLQFVRALPQDEDNQLPHPEAELMEVSVDNWGKANQGDVTIPEIGTEFSFTEEIRRSRKNPRERYTVLAHVALAA